VVRFHRSELNTPYPGRLDPARTDAIVFVADWVRAAAVEKFGWDPGATRFEVIENVVDAARLRRPKLEGADFTIALVGYVPRLKRLDRALDLLEHVRLHDRRFRLLVKGHPPWSYEWMLGNSDELGYYETCFARIRNSPLLGHAVTFEEHGDIVEFFQKAGWIASLSDIEGHAVALSVGMAAGCIPIVAERPGASDQYPREWIHKTPAAAARWLLEVVADGRMREQMEAAAAYARRWSPDAVLPRWRELLLDS
jgi:glycosyltransferase involved in cell wall biosynthesis